MSPIIPWNIRGKRNTKKSDSHYSPQLILKVINTFIRVTAVGRTGVQVDATVCVHGDHRAEATVYGHHAAVTVAAAPAAVVIIIIIIIDHHHLSRVSSWETPEKENFFVSL